MRVVLCLFGVIQRSIRFTWPAIAGRIVRHLQREGMAVSIYVFSLNVGDAVVDGCHMEESDLRLIPYDTLEVVGQSALDADIDAACTPTLSRCPIYKVSNLYTSAKQNFSHAIRRNAIRQLLSEAAVGRYLERHSSQFDAAVVIGPDFFPLDHINVSDLRLATSHRNAVFVSPAYQHGGITNGFYVGKPAPVARILRRGEDFVHGKLWMRAGRGYESTVGAAFSQYRICPLSTSMTFFKIRANARIKNDSLTSLFRGDRSFYTLTAPGRAKAAEVHARIEARLRPLGLPDCLSQRAADHFRLFEDDAREMLDTDQYAVLRVKKTAAIARWMCRPCCLSRCRNAVLTNATCFGTKRPDSLPAGDAHRAFALAWARRASEIHAPAV